jgi:sulfoxide reductase heme-binding subunit YedZ
MVHLAAWLPLGMLLFEYLDGSMSLMINPIQEITLRTGKTALILLLLSLSCTPIYTLTGFKPALRVRRPLGLYAFFYAILHFFIFVGLDYGFDWALIQGALFEKRYALVGLAAFLILLPLAVTSTKWWQMRLKRAWKRLHRLVYLAGLLVVVHYMWLVKSDTRIPLAYGAGLAFLLLARVPRIRRWLSQQKYSLQRLRRLIENRDRGLSPLERDLH